MYIIQGEKSDWEVVIGLEVHAQIISEAKLFSGAATSFGAEPNSQVSLVDAAMPGMLPVVNEVCIEQAVRTGLGLNSKINLHSVFEVLERSNSPRKPRRVDIYWGAGQGPRCRKASYHVSIRHHGINNCDAHIVSGGNIFCNSAGYTGRLPS